MLVLLDEPTNGLDPAGPRRDARADPAHRRGLRHLGAGHLAPHGRDRADLRPRRGDRRRPAAALGVHGRRDRGDPAAHRRGHRPARRRWLRHWSRPGSGRERWDPCWRSSWWTRRRTTSCATWSPTSGSAWSGCNAAGTTCSTSSGPKPSVPTTRACGPTGRRQTGPAPAGPTGAIHDIGYRHYDGPRLGPTYIARSLFVHSLRGAYGLGRSTRTKVMPLLLLAVMVVPALLIAAIAIVTGQTSCRSSTAPMRRTSRSSSRSSSASQAPQSVSRDLRFHVVALYFPGRCPGTTTCRRSCWPCRRQSSCCSGCRWSCCTGARSSPSWPSSDTHGFLVSLAGAVCSLSCSPRSAWSSLPSPRDGASVSRRSSRCCSCSPAWPARSRASLTTRATIQWRGMPGSFPVHTGRRCAGVGLRREVVTIARPPGTAGGIAFVLVTVALVAACYALLVRRYRKVSVP